MARSCFCMGPTCPDCGQVRADLAAAPSNAVVACSCFQPDCAQCMGPRPRGAQRDVWPEDERRGAVFVCGRGAPLQASAKGVVHNVHVMVKVLLEEGVLQKGPAWKEVPHATKKDRKERGTVLDNVVSRLTHVPVRSVLAVEQAYAAPGTTKVSNPKAPGRKKKAVCDKDAVRLKSQDVSPDKSCLGPEKLPQIQSYSARDAQVALVLGRAAMDALIHGTDTQYARTVVQLFQAGVDVGHKHHDRHTPRALAHAATGLLRKDLCQLLGRQPNNMKNHKLLSLWSLQCDSAPRFFGGRVKAKGSNVCRRQSCPAMFYKSGFSTCGSKHTYLKQIC